MKLYVHMTTLVVAAVALSSCIKMISDDCTVTQTCVIEGGGGAADGGKGAGTGSTTGGDNGGTGGTVEAACSPACSGDTPVCDEAAKECVGCLADKDCSGDAALCDTASQSCVACLDTTDCTDGAASVCESGACGACSTNDDCAHISGKGICDAGACVECSSESDCGGNVCDPVADSCTQLPAGALVACQECQFDAECKTGQLCVEQKLNSTVVGNYCTWTREAHVPGDPSCFTNGRPYANDVNTTSVNGVTADMCVLRTTTCAALAHHSQSVTGCVDTTSGSDDACGAAGVADGVCELKSGVTPLCSYPCLSDEDCSPGAACTAEKYCAL